MVPTHYSNPVYPRYFADPFVWRCRSEYLAIGTGPDDAGGTAAVSPSPTVFPLLRSTDLVEWRPAGWALVRPDTTLGDAFWAPEVAESGGQWYLYYSVGHGDRAHQVRVAASLDPLGPYVDVAALTSPDEVRFAIDPHPFQDADGRWYLFHARDFLDLSDEHGRAVRAGTALVVSPMTGMTSLEPGTCTVARARCDWQRFSANRSMYGRVFDWHTLEGPFVVRHAGRYYCLFSGGCWQDATYGVDFVSAEHVMGPWLDDGIELGPRILRSVPGRVVGPGHCSVVTGPDETRRYLAYHAWDGDMTARRLCIDELEFTPAGPRSSGPSWTPRPAPTSRQPRAS